ncbi:MAG: hypothetical protein ACKOAS_06490, partial [Verrucomicrobiota bacterium]
GKSDDVHKADGDRRVAVGDFLFPGLKAVLNGGGEDAEEEAVGVRLFLLDEFFQVDNAAERQAPKVSFS